MPARLPCAAAWADAIFAALSVRRCFSTWENAPNIFAASPSQRKPALLRWPDRWLLRQRQECCSVAGTAICPDRRRCRLPAFCAAASFWPSLAKISNSDACPCCAAVVAADKLAAVASAPSARRRTRPADQAGCSTTCGQTRCSRSCDSTSARNASRVAGCSGQSRQSLVSTFCACSAASAICSSPV